MPPKKKNESEPKAPKKPRASAKPKTPKAEKPPKAVKEPKAPKAQASKIVKPAAVKVPKAKAEKGPAAKKSAGPRVSASPLKKLQRKGETQMVAFIRDPQCLFTYWEVTPESIESVQRQLQGEFQNSSMVLRVFHKDSDGKVELIQEIFVEPKEMNRYISIADPRGLYYLEIAQRSASGQLFVYARSNDLMAGSSGFTGSSWSAPASDPQWQTPEGLLEYMSQEEYTETFLTPGGVSSADSLRRRIGRFASSSIK